ncbi:MAG: hypothetical protein AABX05_01785 [Nanoarchaeota archaeon]
MSSTNLWKYAQADIDVKNNPYLNPSLKPAPEPAPSADAVAASPQVTVSTVGDFLHLGNISCVDADGNTFEQYNNLAVSKDIFRNGQAYITLTPYQAVVHSQGKGLFLPSIALSCNIVAALFQQAVRMGANGAYTTLDLEAKKVLDQYKDYGSGHGWHAQNTVINYETQKIIHYPCDADFPNHGGASNINSSRQRIELPFEKIKKNGLFSRDNVLRNKTLEDGLKDPLITPFVKQFTGLADPSILIQIGQYFQKPAKVWFPTNPVKAEDCTETRSAWLGCDSICLYLDGDYDLDDDNAVRGVSRSS